MSRLKWVRNIFIVWFCTGFWHGANWNFIIWGLYFGILLAVEKLFLSKILLRLPSWLRHIYTLTLVFFSFVIFYIESITEMWAHLAGMLGASGIPAVSSEALYYLRSYALLLAIACVGATPLLRDFANRLREREKAGSAMLVLEPVFYVSLMIVTTGYLVDSSFNPFLYFRF